MGPPYRGVDYNLTYVHSRVDSNTFTTGKPMPESTLTPSQSRFYPPVRDFGFSLLYRQCVAVEGGVGVVELCCRPYYAAV
jgi:hypothetical protein